jgi:hypothetical protein
MTSIYDVGGNPGPDRHKICHVQNKICVKTMNLREKNYLL